MLSKEDNTPLFLFLRFKRHALECVCLVFFGSFLAHTGKTKKFFLFCLEPKKEPLSSFRLEDENELFFGFYSFVYLVRTFSFRTNRTQIYFIIHIYCPYHCYMCWYLLFLHQTSNSFFFSFTVFSRWKKKKKTNFFFLLFSSSTIAWKEEYQLRENFLSL